MKYFLALVLFCFVGLEVSYAQSGAQALRLAQSIYEQGRLHELPFLEGLKPEKIATYSKSEQVTAYRLLTLAHIYLEEPEQADVAMLQLLDADHFYEPNSNVEPAEFMGLYKTFRTRPVFNIGVKFGANTTIPLLSSIYYVSSNAEGNGKYAPKVGIQYGLVFEKEFFNNSKKAILKRLIFAPEILLMGRTFGYTNKALFYDDQTGVSAADQKVTLKQNWLDINPVFQLKVGKGKSTSFIPYLGFGPGVSYLLKATNSEITTRASSAGAVIGPDVVTTSGFRKLLPSVIASAGFKYRFGDVYVAVEGRVQYTLMNPVNSSKRTINQSVFEYNYTTPNYKPLNFIINVGIIFPYFKPIKLIRK